MSYFKLTACIICSFIFSISDSISLYAMKSNSSSAIIINLPSYMLGYYENNKLIHEYPIAIGKMSTPTPCGVYTIQDKEINPCWYPPNKIGHIVPSGPDNPLGYRWIGFKSNYGIHGTNAPWSIGSAVSNGCIRMKEEDVEELFDAVSFHTSITIIYDRINIKVNSIGQATIEIYPDVYGYEDITIEKIKDKLLENRVNNLIEDEVLLWLLNKGEYNKVLFANVSNLRINNKKTEEYLVWREGILYAPIEKISNYLECRIDWDEKSQLVVSGGHRVPGIMKNHILYVEIKYLPELFNVEQKWDQDNNCLLVNAPALLMGDQFITHNIQRIDDSIYVPMAKILEVLGRKIDYDTKSQTYWLGGRKIAVKELRNEVYVEVNKISDYFNMNIVYDETVKTINMKGFCCAIDYSMYLGEMGDFVE